MSEQLCENIARRLHHGQYRHDGVTEYVSHPQAVANKFKEADPEARCVAWLHDAIEDTVATEESLRSEGVPDRVVDAVVVMTKGKYETYQEYLCRVKRNSLARRVKIEDMLHNLSCDPTDRQVVKYAKALLFLFEP